jgi:hypothetical protein
VCFRSSQTVTHNPQPTQPTTQPNATRCVCRKLCVCVRVCACLCSSTFLTSRFTAWCGFAFRATLTLSPRFRLFTQTNPSQHGFSLPCFQPSQLYSVCVCCGVAVCVCVFPHSHTHTHSHSHTPLSTHVALLANSTVFLSFTLLSIGHRPICFCGETVSSQHNCSPATHQTIDAAVTT